MRPENIGRSSDVDAETIARTEPPRNDRQNRIDDLRAHITFVQLTYSRFTGMMSNLRWIPHLRIVIMIGIQMSTGRLHAYVSAIMPCEAGPQGRRLLSPVTPKHIPIRSAHRHLLPAYNQPHSEKQY